MADHSKDSLVRMREVKSRTGLSAATIYRRIATGDFPRQIALSKNVVAWYSSDIDAWVADPLGWHKQAA